MSDISVAIDDILRMCKMRLSRLDSDTSQDEYLRLRIMAAADECASIGMPLHDNVEDRLLLCDLAVWQYQNRDKADGMPAWLRLRRRERWLKAQTEEAEDDDT